LRKIVLVPDISSPLQRALVAEGHVADEQFLVEDQTLNKEESLIYEEE
jgi:hypothetical protein